jgi:hypothetical protein
MKVPLKNPTISPQVRDCNENSCNRGREKKQGSADTIDAINVKISHRHGQAVLFVLEMLLRVAIFLGMIF